VVLAPYVLPGELVTVETRPAKGDILRATVKSVEEPSPERAAPACVYFTKCGGCHYQHMNYAFQRKQKESILRETLLRTGGFEYDADIPTLSAEPLGYRNRIQLHFSRRKMGFRRAESHELCPIESCPIASPRLNEAIAAFNSKLRRPEWPDFLQSLEVFTNETDVHLNIVESMRPVAVRFFAWCADFVPGFLQGSIEYRAVGHTFRISRGSFFQVNRFLIDSLAAEVLRDYRGESVLDLYAGVGLFTVPLAERFERVAAVERSASAFRDLQQNCETLGPRVTSAKTATEDFLAHLTEAPQLVVADPPRTGLGKDAAQHLLRLNPEMMAIVSCDPATLARDLKILKQGYRIDRMVLVDLFPQTYHFETIVHLVRS
jgi:23S rRNA (uracil1939-C5)-methyltransferase